MAKTLPSDAGGAGSIPGQGPEIAPCLTAKNPEQKTEAIL